MGPKNSYIFLGKKYPQWIFKNLTMCVCVCVCVCVVRFGPFIKSILNLLQYCFGFTFWTFGLEACGILTLCPGIEPALSVLEGGVLTTGPPGKSPQWILILSQVREPLGSAHSGSHTGDSNRQTVLKVALEDHRL